MLDITRQSLRTSHKTRWTDHYNDWHNAWLVHSRLNLNKNYCHRKQPSTRCSWTNQIYEHLKTFLASWDVSCKNIDSAKNSKWKKLIGSLVVGSLWVFIYHGPVHQSDNLLICDGLLIFQLKMKTIINTRKLYSLIYTIVFIHTSLQGSKSADTNKIGENLKLEIVAKL